MKQRQHLQRCTGCLVFQDHDISDNEQHQPGKDTCPANQSQPGDKECRHHGMNDGEPGDPVPRPLPIIECRDGPQAPGPVIYLVNQVINPEMCKGERVEEDEVQKRRGIRTPGADVPGNREECEVCPADDLGEREDLWDPLLYLVEHFDDIAVHHHEQHVHRMGVGKREDKNRRNPREHPEKGECMGRRDESCRDRTGTEEPPVPGQESVLNIFFIKVPVDIIVQHQAGLEAEETDKGDYYQPGPREPAVGHRRQQVPGTEQEGPGKGELQPREVDVCPQGQIHHHMVGALRYFTLSPSRAGSGIQTSFITSAVQDNRMDSFIIRPEHPDDIDAIFEVNFQAFGQDGEARLVNALRDEGEYNHELSLVAESDDRIIGHILFPPIAIVSDTAETAALALAPLAVHQDFQCLGIGTALIGEGLMECRRLGHRIVIVVGHPTYYPKFGFVTARNFGIRAPFPCPDASFMALPLASGALDGISGTVRYPHAFDAVGAHTS